MLYFFKKIFSIVFIAFFLTVSNTSMSNALPLCKGNEIIFWNDCFGTLYDPNFGTYKGGWKNGKYHGEGTLSSSSTGFSFTTNYSNGREIVGPISLTLDEFKKIGTSKIISAGALFDTSKPITIIMLKDACLVENICFPRGAKYFGMVNERDEIPDGEGILTFPNGLIQEGVFQNGKFKDARNTKFSNKENKLKDGFLKLEKFKRKKIQSVLSDLGYYNSSVDALYGKGTETALKIYNKYYFNNSDISNNNNINKLFDDILR